MSSEDDDDLFGGGSDSDDTAELLAAATQNQKKPPPKPKTIAKPKQDASDDDDDGGLFDSDSDEDEPVLSKKQKLENLARRKKQKQPPKKKKPPKTKKDANKKEEGYESGNSYDSETFERTAEDDAFIDTTGEDADAVNELYAEQNFDDERPHPETKKKKKRKQQSSDNDGDAEPDNPIMAAVHRMKKKKRVKQSSIEIEDELKVFLHKMDSAAEKDETCLQEKKPALHKLQMLNTVCEELTKKDRQRILIELDLLTVIKRWIQPLPNGSLGNVTVRQKLLDSLFLLENEITSNDLRRSELGKTVMTLAKHRSETPHLKRQWRTLIENWSRPIFKKSGNMRDLDKVQRGSGMAAAAAPPRQQAPAGGPDLQSMIESGKKAATTSSTRVSVPFSKGFAYSVRPQGKVVDSMNPNKQVSDIKNKLQKRMVEKGRKKSKNQRSANISVEGRKTK